MGHLGSAEILKVQIFLQNIKSKTSNIFNSQFVEEVTGSLKDFSYIFSNNLDISLQLSCCKFPKSFFLVKEWENNKESLLSYLEQVHMGVKGLVSRDGNTLQPGAEVIVWNPDGSRRAKSVLTSQDGEYWRVLLPNVAGNNTFTVQVIPAFYWPRDHVTT